MDAYLSGRRDASRSGGDIGFGLYPPNVLLLTAGVGEVGVGISTAYRAMVDPVLPLVHVPGSVFLPAVAYSVGLAALIGGCACAFNGSSWQRTASTVIASSAGAAISTATTFAAAGSGFVAPFLGPLAGVASFLLLKKVLDAALEPNPPGPVYGEYAQECVSVFPHEQVLTLTGIPDVPIGMLKGERLLLNQEGIRDTSGHWIGRS